MFFLLALPYLVFPVIAGIFVAADHRSAGSRWSAAASTGGTGALATAFASFLTVDGGDRTLYVAGWIVAAPVATALAIPLVAAGRAVVSAQAERRTQRLLRLLVVGGAFLILAAR